MKITIIIPTYNRAHLIKRTLDSVYAQTHDEIELIIVDNNSTDNTLEIIENFRNNNKRNNLSIKTYNESVQSSAAARNTGLLNATSEWIVFFDSDDVMNPHLLEEYSKKIAKNKGNVDIILARADRTDLDGNVSETHFYTKNFLSKQILNSILITTKYIIRRDFIIKCGSWDAEMLGWNDWELGVRLLLNKPRVKWINSKILIHIYSQANSITGKDYSSKINIWSKAIDKVEHLIETSNISKKKYYLSLIKYRKISLAALCTKEKDPIGKQLYKQVQSEKDNFAMNKALFALLYQYIILGGRGGSHIYDKCIRIFFTSKRLN